jgi:hypothetical protein
MAFVKLFFYFNYALPLALLMLFAGFVSKTFNVLHFGQIIETNPSRILASQIFLLQLTQSIEFNGGWIAAIILLQIYYFFKTIFFIFFKPVVPAWIRS